MRNMPEASGREREREIEWRVFFCAVYWVHHIRNARLSVHACMHVVFNICQ